MHIGDAEEKVERMRDWTIAWRLSSIARRLKMKLEIIITLKKKLNSIL